MRRAIVENHRRRRNKILKAAQSSPPLIVAPQGHDPKSPSPLIIALHGYGDSGEHYPNVWGAAGGYIPDIDQPPTADGREPAFYFMVGSRDKAISQVRRAAADYSEAGYAVKLRVVAGTGHSFPRDTDRELGKALRFVLEN